MIELLNVRKEFVAEGGRVHVALDTEPDAAEELELVGADVGRVGWEYR